MAAGTGDPGSDGEGTGGRILLRVDVFGFCVAGLICDLVLASL